MTAQADVLRRVRHALTQLRAENPTWGGKKIRVVLAVSGGRDSVVMLDVMHKLRQGENIEIAIAHFDHGLRPESESDATFVCELAKLYGVDCFRERGVPDTKRNVEDWGRSARYEFLQRVLQEWVGDILFTAHHGGDQAETILFRLATGRLCSDLHGIARYDAKRALFRPLLDLLPTTIAQYATQNQLKFVHDSTNDDLTRARNQLRHVVVPQLEEINSGVITLLGAFATRVGRDEDYLESMARSFVENETWPYACDALDRIPTVLRWRCLRILACRGVGNVARRVSFKRWQELAEQMSRKPRHRIELELGGGISAVIENTGLVFQAQAAISEKVSERLALDIPGEVFWNGDPRGQLKIQAEVIASSDGRAGNEGHQAMFDLDRLPHRALIIRSRQPGDRVSISQSKHRKLKKLFSEQGLMLTLRDAIPIVECAGRVLWVPGIIRASEAVVDENSRRILRISCLHV